MKKIPILIVIICFLSSFEQEPYFSPTNYEPVLLTMNDLRGSISIQPGREISDPGKIYLYKDYILIVEKYKGVHLINNSDSTSPSIDGFIQVPGCMDIAMRNNVLYVDNAVDLVSIDMSQLPILTELDRVGDVFPEPTPPDLEYIPYEFSSRNRPKNTVIVGWQVKNNNKNN